MSRILFLHFLEISDSISTDDRAFKVRFDFTEEEEIIMDIKLMNIENVDKLFEAVDRCNGKVELVGDDIRLNLKSKLSQYFSMAKLFSDGEIPELNLVTHDPEDATILMRFMMDNKTE